MGSAIKGMAFFSISHLATVGYDQRLSLWALSAVPEDFNFSEKSLSYQEADHIITVSPTIKEDGFKWVSGAMVNIGDIEGLGMSSSYRINTDEDASLIVVVGQGMQSFILKNKCNNL